MSKMSISGLASSGFVIAVAVSLLLTGAVVYYFNRRVANVERTLQQQQGILTDFISNVKNRIQTTSQPIVSGGTNAFGSEKFFGETLSPSEAHNEKVVVSEDESDSETESESSEEADHNLDAEDQHGHWNEGEKLDDVVTAVPLASLATGEQSEAEAVSISDIFATHHKEQTTEPSTTEKLTENSIGKLKVTELREKAKTELGLDEIAAKKMKKAELVKALIEGQTEGLETHGEEEVKEEMDADEEETEKPTLSDQSE